MEIRPAVAFGVIWFYGNFTTVEEDLPLGGRFPYGGWSLATVRFHWRSS